MAKVTNQLYGLVLRDLLEQAVTLSDEEQYWEQVLGSQLYSAYYSLQTLPPRGLRIGQSIVRDVRAKSRQSNLFGTRSFDHASHWREYYNLVKQVTSEQISTTWRHTLLSPVARLRIELQDKRDKLRRARLGVAKDLGQLVGQGLYSTIRTTSDEHEESFTAGSAMDAPIVKSIDLCESLLGDDTTKTDRNSADVTHSQTQQPNAIHTVATSLIRLSNMLEIALPRHRSAHAHTITRHGRPSRAVRYWPIVVTAALSSTTVLRVLLNRQAELTEWVRDLGSTTIDFWTNWVVEPTRRVIGTIRHDEGSQVSIMSKRSLQGDRDSLERMVVDFAIDNPGNATGTGAPLTDSEIATIRTNIKDGDLTPVLKAYERDLAHPFMGTVRGNLIRALLIQVQKTKVDVEVAMGGIDALLKSQELVFGFVGLTPGLLVTIALFRWLGRVSLGRKATSRASTQSNLLGRLRNVDRAMTRSGGDNGKQDAGSYGMLLCEAHVFEQNARRVMPAAAYRELSRDLRELVDVTTSHEQQRKVLDRIRWAYGKWL